MEHRPDVDWEDTLRKIENEEKKDTNKPFEEMSVEELQEAILEKMRKNGCFLCFTVL